MKEFVEKECVVIFALPKGEKVLTKCGSSSVGRARPCQGRGRESESRLPLQKIPNLLGLVFFCSTLSLPEVARSPGGGIGRRAGLKILFAVMRVRVQFPSGAQKESGERQSVERCVLRFFYV